MLELHEAEVLFGLCGDTSLPFYDALRQVDHRMQHVLCRDERRTAICDRLGERAAVHEANAPVSEWVA